MVGARFGEALHDLHIRLRPLSDHHRLAVLLHDVADLPHRDVAFLVGMEPAAVRQVVSRFHR
jgi:DNA-directed RNA polymerase specialized sigma24 family protein